MDAQSRGFGAFYTRIILPRFARREKHRSAIHRTGNGNEKALEWDGGSVRRYRVWFDEDEDGEDGSEVEGLGEEERGKGERRRRLRGWSCFGGR